MKKLILLLLVAFSVMLGCTGGSEGPGETVPGPPKSEVLKGAQPPSQAPTQK